ncbi:MAG: mechanosensitive ion channel family protein [Ignavibacteriaceae bacterium]|nr:mechanosensitive ion channel family protein [Ignavibacteriaceae bacterium]
MQFLKDYTENLKNYPFLYENAIFFGTMILALVSYFITRKVVVPLILKLAKKTSNELDDILLNKKLLRRFSYLAPVIIIKIFSSKFPFFDTFLGTVTESLIIILIFLIISSVLDTFNDLWMLKEKNRNRPIKGYFQTIKMILFIWMAVILIGLFSQQNPWTIVTGLSAFTAVLLLIFRDTLLSFVASIQINKYDLILVGDWIEVPGLGVDGEVIDVSLNVIRVKNFDNSITMVPTYKIMENSMKNWRGMYEAEGRRIRRSFLIDYNTMKMCDENLLEKLSHIRLIAPFIEAKKTEFSSKKVQAGFIPEDFLTNITAFIYYAQAYLLTIEDLNQNYTRIVRMLAPSELGIPIEVYAFSKKTKLIEFEQVQGEIFDHLIAMLNEFDLRLYQRPSGLSLENSNQVKTLKSVD